MLPPPITVVGSAVSGAFIWLSYMTCPVVLFVIFIRNLSVPPPPLTCPSIAVSTNAYEPAPLMVPSPLYCALAPDITSEVYDVLSKVKLARSNWNCVSPVGTLPFFGYFDTNPNLALPVSVGLG